MEVDIAALGTELSRKDSKTLLMQLNESLHVRDLSAFPGSQPVTMMRKDIGRLLKEDYYVCEKTDGVRALMYIANIRGKMYVFLIDRKCRVVRIRKRVFPGGSSLFDGEVVAAKDAGGACKCNYMVFDMAMYNNEVIIRENFLLRLSAAIKFLYKNEQWLKSAGLEGDADALGIFVKKMHKSYGLAEVYRMIIPNLTHENDGLIFTAVDHPYVVGTSQGYLKWKPAHLNTIDFKLQKDPSAHGLYKLAVIGRGDKPTVFDFYWIEDMVKDIPCNVEAREGGQQGHYKLDADPLSMDGKIGEFAFRAGEYTMDPCTMDLVKERWSLIRIREDKLRPNSYRVAASIMHSIREGLEYNELEQSVPEIRRQWKSRDQESAHKRIKPTPP